MNTKYYALEQTGKKAELYIFGNISSYAWREKDRDAYGIVKELQDIDADEIHVYINSTGGSVAEGLAIYNVLKSHHAKVYTYDSGFACSAASVAFMAGDERIMYSSSLFMIHNAWSYGEGNAAYFRKQAEDLDIITQASVKAYMEKVSITEEEVKKMMDEETWLSAEKAKEYGFATKIYEEKTEEANLSAMQTINQKLLSVPKTQEEIKVPTAKEIAQEIVKEMKLEQEKPVSAWSAFFGEKKGE